MSEDRGAEAMAKLSIFLSSVQKELENERVSVQNLIQTDPFLSAHCAPILYEYEPAAPHDATVGCLAVLDTCQIYILMVWQEYGAVGPDGLSITHREYRRAKERKLPILAFIKGAREVGRKPKTESFLKEVDADKLKYKRFGNVIDLQKEVRAALLQLLKSTFRIAPSSDENIVAAQNIEATSAFESQPLTRLRWEDLDEDVARKWSRQPKAKTPPCLHPRPSCLALSYAASSGTMPACTSTTPQPPALFSWPGTPRRYSRNAASWPMPSVVPKPVENLMTTRTSVVPCRWPLSGRWLSSSETLGIRCALWDWTG